jgi:hypothetical protein
VLFYGQSVALKIEFLLAGRGSAATSLENSMAFNPFNADHVAVFH